MTDSLKPARERTLPLQPDEIRTADLPSKTLYRSRFTSDLSVRESIQWEPPALDVVAGLFPAYQIVSLLGRGGMGAVYHAREIAKEREAAIKLLPAEVSGDHSYQYRFAQEAQALAHLDHPRVVAVHYAGTTEGYSYIIMEYVAGSSLEALLRDSAATLPELVKIMAEICEGLIHAHSKGVVHRDITPGNILLDGEGHTKIADFGVARITTDELAIGGQTTGSIFGTLAYMAPEQLRREKVDHRADLYSVGAILREIVRREKRLQRTLWLRQRQQLDSIVHGAMQTDPERRLATADELLLQLRRVQAGWAGKVRAIWAATVVAALLGMVGLWLYLRPVAAPVPLVSQPPGGLTATSTAAPWHDWIAETRARGSLPSELIETADGLLVQQANWISVGPHLEDQGLRVVFQVPRRTGGTQGSRAKLQLALRASADGVKSYGANAFVQNWFIVRRDRSSEFVKLKEIPVSSAIHSERDHSSELLIRGDTIHHQVDGGEKQTVVDTLYQRGSSGILAAEGVLLKKIEWADLGSPKN